MHVFRFFPCVLLLAGCGSLSAVSPTVDDQVIVAAVQSCDAPPVGQSTPATFMEVGFTQVKAACEAFFVNATRIQQNALAANTALNAGLVGATSILNATASATAAAKAISITQAGVIFSEALLTDYLNVYTFNTYLYKVRQLVDGSMADYIKSARQNPPPNYCIAYTYVSDLASLCSLAAMKADLDQQVALPSTVSNTPPPSVSNPRLVGAHAPGPHANIANPGGLAPSPNYTVRPAGL